MIYLNLFIAKRIFKNTIELIQEIDNAKGDVKILYDENKENDEHITPISLIVLEI